MRKALLGFILTALFVSGPVIVVPAQTPGNTSPAGQGNGSSLGAAKAELQDVEDVIVISEKKEKAKKESPANQNTTAAPPAPKVDPQQVENLKILRDQLRAKILRAEQARNPAEAQVFIKDALLQADAARSVKQNVAGVPPGSAGVVERAIMQKFGSPALEQLRAVDRSLATGKYDGAGAPSSHTIYDLARPRAGAQPDPVAPAPNRIMQGGVSGAPSAGATVSGSFKPATLESARGAVSRYGSQFGGVVLEGTGTNLPPIQKVEYNRMANALVINDRAVYFSPVSARALSTLARAIAEDERVGVSLGSTHVVTKSLPPESEVALDLKIADHFLGDIVFGRPEWTRGYRFRNGFEPQKHAGDDFHVAVYFTFNGFAFSIDGDELRGAQAGLDVSLVPLSDKKAGDGGHLPDEDAILRHAGSRQYEANAQHVADNIDYYRGEKLIDGVFAYGEVAALLRAMKRDGRDLAALARAIETINGFTAAEAARSTPAPASDTRGVPTAVAASMGPRLWDHNNSVMSLEASGASRRFYYRQPREGMLRAGAEPGSLLFEGRQSGRQIAGTAYIFAGHCGQKPYQVQGEIRDDGSIVMRGLAPRIDRSSCQAGDTRADELVFTPRGAPAVAASGPGVWEHNGSAMSLQVSGSSVKFLYRQPRPGMLEAGAQPGSLLFDGQRSGTQVWGTAYVFSRSCGPQAYSVQGEIFDNGSAAVMRGDAPRVNPTTCQLVDTRQSELVFRAAPSAPRPEVVQMQNHWAAYLRRIQERNEYPNWSAPPYDLYQSRPTGRG
jgi:hypothetical protein